MAMQKKANVSSKYDEAFSGFHNMISFIELGSPATRSQSYPLRQKPALQNHG